MLIDDKLIIDESINAVLKSLTLREESVIRLYYGIGCNRHKLREIAKIQGGVTIERIRQIKVKAESKLRMPKRSKHLAGLLPLVTLD